MRAQIVAAIVAALNSGTPGGVPATEASRTFAGDEAALPSILLYPVRESPEEIHGSGGSVVRAKLLLHLEVRAKGSAGVTADTAADACLSWIGKTLPKNTFGGLALNTASGEINWSFEHGENPVVLAVQEIEVTFQHLAANPDQRI